MRKSTHRWKIEGLGATGPYRNLKEKLALFGQFVGDWDIVEARYPKPDGTEVKRKGEVHFGWILDGRAVQDVWMTIDEDANRAVHGTTIRFYDPKIDAWHSVWISPVKGIVQTFVARKVKDEIVLEGKTPEGYPEKWIFSQIAPNSFRWRSEETHDGGRTCVLTEEMQIKRQSAKTLGRRLLAKARLRMRHERCRGDLNPMRAGDVSTVLPHFPFFSAFLIWIGHEVKSCRPLCFWQ